MPAGEEKIDKELMRLAGEAAADAYAPYSGFRVGAALRCGSGKVHTGVNIENASYVITICAEMAALACAVGDGERVFTGIAVAAADGGDASPCGSCRQALAEFAPGLTVTYRHGGRVVTRGLDRLLPDAFQGGGGK